MLIIIIIIIIIKGDYCACPEVITAHNLGSKHTHKSTARGESDKRGSEWMNKKMFVLDPISEGQVQYCVVTRLGVALSGCLATGRLQVQSLVPPRHLSTCPWARRLMVELASEVLIFQSKISIKCTHNIVDHNRANINIIIIEVGFAW